MQRTFNRIDLQAHGERVSRLKILIVVITAQALCCNACKNKQVEMCMH